MEMKINMNNVTIENKMENKIVNMEKEEMVILNKKLMVELYLWLIVIFSLMMKELAYEFMDVEYYLIVIVIVIINFCSIQIIMVSFKELEKDYLHITIDYYIWIIVIMIMYEKKLVNIMIMIIND